MLFPSWIFHSPLSLQSLAFGAVLMLATWQLCVPVAPGLCTSSQLQSSGGPRAQPSACHAADCIVNHRAPFPTPRGGTWRTEALLAPTSWAHKSLLGARHLTHVLHTPDSTLQVGSHELGPQLGPGGQASSPAGPSP